LAKSPTSRRQLRPTGELPTPAEIIDVVQAASSRIGKNELAKVFALKGGQRVALKDQIGEMLADGRLLGSRKDLSVPGSLPPVMPLEIVAVDHDGELLAEPVTWNHDGPRPRVLIQEDARKSSRRGRSGASGSGADRPLSEGDRILARITPLDADHHSPDGVRHVASVLRRLPRDKGRLVGIFAASKRGGGVIRPVEKKNLREYTIRAGDEADASDGDLVRFDLAKKGRFHEPQARVIEVLGNPTDDRQISLIAVHERGIPDEFPDTVLDELSDLPALTGKGRADLTDLPLVTIDPPDARDHDDAVHAEADPDPANAGGFIVTVAIADVAHYVRPGSRLDREARKRGNSCYFPDRVVPMLPERISNDLCSLRAGEVRPAMVARMWFDKTGAKRRHAFERALIKVAAKLSYLEAQAVFDDQPAGPGAAGTARNLWSLFEAYQTLTEARKRRAPLDLDLPERKVVIGEDGHIADVVVPPRLDAHRLIEEFMIQANVAAAEMLEEKKAPVVYRVHDQPSKEKLDGLRDFLETLGLKLPASNQLKPGDINGVLSRAADLPVSHLVSEVVLRSQSQAVYDTENIGHFGLNLARYAHFTSPIRRYADLCVHRALITALRLGDDGLRPADVDGLRETAEWISDTERRAMAAERDTIDRLVAAYLADRVGATFAARVSGVAKFGLFVRLQDTGADGFIPAGSLGGDEYFEHIEELHAIVGSKSGLGFRLGDGVSVRLVEAVPTAGALRFEMLSQGSKVSLALQKGYNPSKRQSSGGRGRDGTRGRRQPGHTRLRGKRQ